jgi:hypothetical protein
MIHKYYTFDFESYYDSEYSLRKMTVPEYLHDPRFECTGCAVAEGDDGKAAWYDADDFRVFLRTHRSRQKAGEKITVVSHNALFDMCLLAWKFGFLPDLCIDTMAMSRALLFHKTGHVSLAKIAAHLGLPAKTDTILKVQGMRAADIKAAGLWPAYTSYACNDVDLCRGIFKQLRNDFPPSEYVVCDTVLRCAITPRFKLDAAVLAEHLHVTLESKANLLDRCGLGSREALMSNDKFAEVLRGMGVEPGMKTSLTTGKESYAFAKTDDFMAQLEEHENPDVQALVAARLGFKSTIEETRTQRFLALSRLDWGPLGQGWMPVPLRYAGAHTHRLSGDWSLNLQNMGRKSPLRRALIAPKAHSVVAGDESQIEARCVAYIAGQDDLVESFAQGRDVYSEFAGEEVYHRTVTKADTLERFVGKTSILGLGYGMGGPKFTDTINTNSRIQLGVDLNMSLQDGTDIVNAYRRRYANIKRAWDLLQGLLPTLASGGRGAFGPCEIRDGTVIGPNGLRLYYRDLQQQMIDGRSRWRFKYGRFEKDLYGGKLFENIIQFLARIITMNAALTMRRRYPRIPLALQAHDELVYVVPDELVDEFRAALEDALTQPVPWAPGIPLACETGVGPSYGEAK